MTLEFETTVWQSVSTSPSLRTSVPQTIAELLELGKGEVLNWKYDPKSRTVTVTKGKSKSSPKKK